MKVLIIGSGGREHTFAWKIKQSPQVKKIYCAPGNGGMEGLAQCVDIEATDIVGLVKFAKEKKIDLTVVGPEAPLVEGIVDAFEYEGLMVFGPSRRAAQLEGSKIFSKDFMHRWNIPTAVYKSFDKFEDAKKFVELADYPIVVKADGLAAGKGVTVCATVEQAREAIDQMMKQKIFNEAGSRIVIEECLQGEEVSILAISDGENYVVLESAQDHKRVFDDDLGPNTGGMGAYSPAPIVNKELLKKIEARVIEPTIRGMAREGMTFRGVLYAGLMITLNGPMVLEYNVRFGDPETQVVLPRLKTDFVEIMLAACSGKLHTIELEWDKRSCVCVVMCSGGYPGKYKTGMEISGLAEAVNEDDTFVFHAGTKKVEDKILSSGGRVLGVTSLGKNVEEAINRAYQAVDKIKFDHCFFRRDIGLKAVRKIGSKAQALSQR